MLWRWNGGWGRQPSCSCNKYRLATTSLATVPSSVSLQERYYKLGYEDAKELKPFGASLEQAVPPPMEDVYTPSLDPAPTTTKNPLWNMVGMVMSAGYIYKTVTKLGTDATGQFHAALVQQNVATMEPMSMFMLGFSVYNLLKSLRGVVF